MRTASRIPARLRTISAALLIVLAGCQTASEISRPDGLTESQLETAVAAESSGDYPSAVVQYRQLSLRLTDDVDIYLGLARNLRYSGAAAEAYQTLARIPDSLKDGPAYLLERGKVELATGRKAEAVKSLEAARAKDGKNWDVHATLGIAHDMNDDFARARHAYERAAALSKDNPAILNNMAISRALSGDIESAIKILQQAPMVARHSAQMRQNLALFYGIIGDVKKAESLARIDLDDEAVRQNLKLYTTLRRN